MRDDILDPEALYAVEQCARGAAGERQLVSGEFIQSLRDAAIVLGIDFASVVEPHFGSLGEYDQCVYTWRGAGAWATLMFDTQQQRAMLALIGAPSVDKLVGAFAYSTCNERDALRLIDVGPYAEMLVQPIAGSHDVRLIVPELRTELVLRNETPDRLLVLAS